MTLLKAMFVPVLALSLTLLLISCGGSPPVPPDADKDGVLDSMDQCPSTPGVATLAGCPDKDADGVQDAQDKCPAAKGLAKFAGCPDTDNDGIADNTDKCPAQAEDKDNFQDADGCPDTDNDNDGVADVDDACPNERGLVSWKGCPNAALTLYFFPLSARLKPESLTELDGVAVLLNEGKFSNIEIQGHTDTVKGARTEMTMKLSQNRANAVRAYLVKKGLRSDIVVAKGYGDTLPVVSQETISAITDKVEEENARAKNRRVEFRLTFGEPPPLPEKPAVRRPRRPRQPRAGTIARPRRPRPVAAKGLVLDTVVNWGNGKAFITKGGQYSRFDISNNAVDANYPKAIDGKTWPGAPFTQFDAVVNWGNGKVFVFKGNQYARYSVSDDKFDAGYPKTISNATWPGLGFTSVDAAVNWGNGKIYFFKGNQFVRYDLKSNKADAGFPQKISNKTWPGLRFTSVDTATNWGNGKVYFTKGSQYTSFNIVSGKVEAGFPKPLNDKTWSGLRFLAGKATKIPANPPAAQAAPATSAPVATKPPAGTTPPAATTASASAANSAPSGMPRDLVIAHNAARKRAADTAGVSLPEVMWDAGLASYAQAWVNELEKSNSCRATHRPKDGAFAQKHGENLYWASASIGLTGRTSQKINSNMVVMAWESEKNGYDIPSRTCKVTPCGHYTQINWKSTTKMGCAKVTCGNKDQIWVCNYSPAGNITGQKPF